MGGVVWPDNSTHVGMSFEALSIEQRLSSQNLYTVASGDSRATEKRTGSEGHTDKGGHARVVRGKIRNNSVSYISSRSCLSHEDWLLRCDAIGPMNKPLTCQHNYTKSPHCDTKTAEQCRALWLVHQYKHIH